MAFSVTVPVATYEEGKKVADSEHSGVMSHYVTHLMDEDARGGVAPASARFEKVFENVVKLVHPSILPRFKAWLDDAPNDQQAFMLAKMIEAVVDEVEPKDLVLGEFKVTKR